MSSQTAEPIVLPDPRPTKEVPSPFRRDLPSADPSMESNVIYVRALVPASLTYAATSGNVEERVNLWATNDPLLRRFGGLNGWSNFQLNEYDGSHARSDEEKAALKASYVIMGLCPEEFYETHPYFFATHDARTIIEYLQAQTHWMDEEIRFAKGREAKNRQRGLNSDEERELRTAVCSRIDLQQRFRAFFFVYHHVLGQKLEYKTQQESY